jgi:Asp-tRNA(Asn)/Glu-tRNA(Gln) amidotransferase B subunit
MSFLAIKQMNTDKLKSFIKHANSEMTHIICMADHFERFMESEIVDAKEYFTQQGLIYTVHIEPSDVEICKEVFNVLLKFKDSSFKLEVDEINKKEKDIQNYVIGKVMKAFGGNVNPSRVKDIFEELNK